MNDHGRVAVAACMHLQRMYSQRMESLSLWSGETMKTARQSGNKNNNKLVHLPSFFLFVSLFASENPLLNNQTCHTTNLRGKSAAGPWRQSPRDRSCPAAWRARGCRQREEEGKKRGDESLFPFSLILSLFLFFFLFFSFSASICTSGPR
jgi:hypothetical protein